MAKHITTEHGGSSTIALRNELRSIWQRLKAKSVNLASTLNFITSLRHRSRYIPAEAELFLLILSIFPNDFRIPIGDLVVDMMGLGLFEDEHNMFAARSRVRDIILMINDKRYSRRAIIDESGLSPENGGSSNQYVKLLNGAFDLVKYPSEFCRVILEGKWPESNLYKECYGLSLVLKKVNEHPSHFECPNMALLQLQHRQDSQSLPIDFFEGMKELRVLSLDITSLPQSLNVLRNLRTLRLKVTKFEDTSSIGGLVNLEFLSLSALSLMEIPREIKKLENLKFLDLRRMSITYFPPGILSRLLKLEELYLPMNFSNWGCKAKNCDDHDELEFEDEDDYIGEERINASLIEIVSPSLNTLQVCVPKASVLPKSSSLFKNLREFRIVKKNNVLYEPFGKYSANVMQLTGEVSDIKKSGISVLLSRAEVLNLTRVQNLNSVIYQLEENGFPNLKKMIVSESDELEYIVEGPKKRKLSEGDYLFKKLECLHLSMLPNLRGICLERWEGLHWFSNLSQISIRFCRKLKYLLPLSIVRGLTLRKIEILECKRMEGIFYAHKNDNIPPMLCSVESLDLYSLPRLISLLACNGNTIDEVYNDITKPVTIDKVLFPARFVTKWFLKLKSLKISNCDSVGVVFFLEEDDDASKAINSLEVLELHGLRNLVHIWSQVPPKTTAFKNLQFLVLSECRNVYLFSYRVAKLLVQLQRICISRCEKMEEIIVVKDDENESKGRIVLPRLKHLELRLMPNLRILFGGTCEIELPSLESLVLKQCRTMKPFSNGLMRMPNLEGVEVNGCLIQLLRKDLNVITKRATIPHSFTLVDLKMSTRNFSSHNIVGLRGYGSFVYKGWIDKKTFAPSKPNVGMPVSIKRMNTYREWKSEIEILGSKLHPNLVPLLGYCHDGGDLLLVYEFIQGKSLHDHLFTRKIGFKPLSWDMRIKIAIGVARGLNFLHSSSIVHRDVNHTNILLDNYYNLKVADFGLAMWGPSDEMTAMKYTAKVSDLGLASYGDQRITHRASLGIDVYSFGVVLLELMTGLKVHDMGRREDRKSVEWLKRYLSQETELREHMDSTMDGQYSSEAMSLMADLILECLRLYPKVPPAMAEVLDKLLEIESIKQQGECEGHGRLVSVHLFSEENICRSIYSWCLLEDRKYDGELLAMASHNVMSK